MVDFRLTEEQIIIRNEVRRFVQNEVKPLVGELDAKCE